MSFFGIPMAVRTVWRSDLRRTGDIVITCSLAVVFGYAFHIHRRRPAFLRNPVVVNVMKERPLPIQPEEWLLCR